MTPSLAVLHVETGRHLYGGALQVYYLMRGLRDNGCRNVLVCPHDSGIAKASVDVAEVHALPMRGDTDLRFIARLRAVIRATQPHLVHLHSRRGADTLGALAARLERVPTVMTRRVASPEPRWFAPLKYRLYDQVIAISHGIREVLIAAGISAERIASVHSAVDRDRFRPLCNRGAFESTFDIKPPIRAIGMVARFIECKGHDHLFAAIPAIVAAFPNVRFLLFGEGPLKPSLRAQVRSVGLEAHVHFAGFRDDLERVLPCLDMLVHPADLEGLGVSLLQAAACGIPVVASAVGGIPDVVRNDVNGILLPSLDPQALARAVIELLNDPDRARRLGAGGRALIEREFSIAAMVEGNLRAYRRVLALPA